MLLAKAIACFFLSFFASTQVIYTTTLNCDTESSDVEMIDSCLIGMKFKDVIQKLKIDTSRITTFDEPPLIIRGAFLSQGDSCKIRLYVERTPVDEEYKSGNYNWQRSYQYILEKIVIGVGWRKPKLDKRRTIGYRIPYWHD